MRRVDISWRGATLSPISGEGGLQPVVAANPPDLQRVEFLLAVLPGGGFCWRFCQVVIFAGGFSQGSSFSGRFARRVSICWPFCQSVVCFSGRFARGVNFAGRFARSSVFLAVLPGRRQSLFYCREGFPYNWCQKQPIHSCAHTRTPPHVVLSCHPV